MAWLQMRMLIILSLAISHLTQIKSRSSFKTHLQAQSKDSDETELLKLFGPAQSCHPDTGTQFITCKSEIIQSLSDSNMTEEILADTCRFFDEITKCFNDGFERCTSKTVPIVKNQLQENLNTTFNHVNCTTFHKFQYSSASAKEPTSCGSNLIINLSASLLIVHVIDLAVEMY